MRWLAPGLVLIPPGARFCGRFLRLLDALGGVRIRGDLEAAAADAAGLIAAVSKKNLRAAAAKHDVQWTLVYEAHYPAAEHSVVPFVRMHSAPSLLIGLHKALGTEHYVDYGHVTPTDADVFIVLHCKNGLLLVNQRNVERSKHPACQLLPVGGEAAAEEDGGGDRKRPRQAEASSSVLDADAASEAECKNLPWWLAPWALRGLSFSASSSLLLLLPLSTSLRAPSWHAEPPRVTVRVTLYRRNSILSPVACPTALCEACASTTHAAAAAPF